MRYEVLDGAVLFSEASVSFKEDDGDYYAPSGLIG